MTGLIVKDFFVMRKTLKSYLMIMLLYVVLAYLDVLNYAFIITFIQVMLMVLPFTAFAYDEQAKWDRYAMSLPLGRGKVVGARYLFVLVLTVITTAIGLFGTASLTLVREVEPVEMLLTLEVSTSLGLLVPAILLPLCYKLGAERARPYLYAIIFIPVIVLFLAFRMGVRIDASWLDRLALSSPGVLLALSSLPLLAALALMFVSYLISCRIAAGKEY